jgi:hypothetical protein
MCRTSWTRRVVKLGVTSMVTPSPAGQLHQCTTVDWLLVWRMGRCLLPLFSFSFEIIFLSSACNLSRRMIVWRPWHLILYLVPKHTEVVQTNFSTNSLEFSPPNHSLAGEIFWNTSDFYRFCWIFRGITKNFLVAASIYRSNTTIFRREYAAFIKSLAMQRSHSRGPGGALLIKIWAWETKVWRKQGHLFPFISHDHFGHEYSKWNFQFVSKLPSGLWFLMSMMDWNFARDHFPARRVLMKLFSHLVLFFNAQDSKPEWNWSRMRSK